MNMKTKILGTLALLTACSAASAALVVVDTVNTSSDQLNQVRLVPTTPTPSSDQNTSTTNWAGSSLTHTGDPASLTREGRTSTADSTASGVLSGGNTFTIASSGSVTSDNRFSRPAPGGTISAISDAGVDNNIAFSVNQLSNYSWSSTFTSTLSSNTSTDLYIFLFDSMNTPVFGCQTCADGTYSGLGQLAAGDYVLSWGGTINSTSSETGTLGNLFGSGDFTQTGFLTLTEAAPVPLPAAAWLLLSGLGGLGFVARRRKAA